MSRGFLASFFAMLCVCFLATSAMALTVPDSECPCTEGPYIPNPNIDCHFQSHVCTRTDGAVTTVDPGKPDTATGQSLNCVNCGVSANCTSCPGTPPAPMLCSQALSVSYTETCSSTTTGGISGPSWIGLEAKLEVAIGHASARSVTDSVDCGSGSFPGCKQGSYSASLSVQTDIKVQITSSYTWVSTWVGSACGNATTGTVPCDGTVTSTASGSSYGSATCSSGAQTDCPAGP